ncbi:MAG: hypothetical protein V1780_05080 [Chloroflexota bacterium]
MKSIIITVMVLATVLAAGCAEIGDLTKGLTSSSQAAAPETVRNASVGAGWSINKIKMGLGGGQDVSVLLMLNDSDRVDGYFYLEKGSDVAFSITGNSLIHQSKGEAAGDSGGLTSDRFSFVASQAQGSTYTLTFHNPADKDSALGKITIFLELIYPAGSPLFVPVAP